MSLAAIGVDGTAGSDAARLAAQRLQVSGRANLKT